MVEVINRACTRIKVGVNEFISISTIPLVRLDAMEPESTQGYQRQPENMLTECLTQNRILFVHIASSCLSTLLINFLCPCHPLLPAKCACSSGLHSLHHFHAQQSMLPTPSGPQSSQLAPHFLTVLPSQTVSYRSINNCSCRRNCRSNLAPSFSTAGAKSRRQ